MSEGGIGVIIGVIIAVIGGVLLVRNFQGGGGFNLFTLWPLVLVAWGGSIALKRLTGEE